MAISRPTVRIDIHLYRELCCFSWAQHTEATVIDLKTGRKFDINYTQQNNDQLYAATLHDTGVELNVKTACCPVKTVTLYSSKNFDDFLRAYTKKFGVSRVSYNLFSRNCAHAVLFAIDYFCPEREEVEKFCHIYKICCCWCYFACGLKIFPAVFCTTPTDVFKLACLLSYTDYGKYPKVTRPSYSSFIDRKITPSYSDLTSVTNSQSSDEEPPPTASMDSPRNYFR